jgi:hypothetical protein
MTSEAKLTRRSLVKKEQYYPTKWHQQPGGRLVDEHGSIDSFKLKSATNERKLVNEAEGNVGKGKGKEAARDEPVAESGGAIPKSEDNDEQKHELEAYRAMMHWLFMVDDEDDQLNLAA